jgi:hypothetical protein
VKSWFAAFAVVSSMVASVAGAQDAAPIRVSGFVESAYALTSRDVDRRITGNLYLPRHDEFLFHAAAIKAERPLPEGRPGGGFVIEAMAGGHAGVVRAAGLDLGSNADVVQAFASAGWPGAGLVVSAGKMATMLGNEVIESPVNPNLSVGHQFVFLENFTDLGVDAAWTGPSGWSARARLANGWDVVTDNNRGKTVFGRIGWSDARRSVAVLGYTGTELPDSVGGQRSGIELLATGRFGPVAATLQLDAGREEALDAEWRAAGAWLVLPLRDRLDLALRAEALDDADGARTSGALGYPAHDGQTLVEMTATLAIRAIPGTLIRPEVRYDRSDIAAFDGERDQWTVALGAALVF